ncbi:hypothetical protein RJ639_004861, partial [Escallonia herrerae]
SILFFFSFGSVAAMETPDSSDLESDPKPEVIYRCKKCRRILASQEHVVAHEPGGGEKCFIRWMKKSDIVRETDKEPPQCSSIFVEPLKWMETLEEGSVGGKLHCVGCKARLGLFNWAGIRCNCGAWVVPAFQLHKNKIDECHL